MDPIKKFALECAKEIVISKVSHSSEYTDGVRGNEVADYFEAIYNKIYEIALNQDQPVA